MNDSIYFYIHIPYCYKKCPYCAFVSYERRFSTQDLYIKQLIGEIKSFKTKKRVKSIYFGGGTPSTLKIEHIGKVLDTVYSNFEIDDDPEITLEANPVSLKEQYLKSLKGLGINRLSVGIQSFNNRKLKILGRLHSAKLGMDSIKKAQGAGFGNISIDLIYGLNETKKDMELELKKTCSLNIQHISTYMLSIEEGTQFEKLIKEDKLTVSGDDETADLYLFIAKYLENSGFEHYEISNFAKEGFKSRHNCSYWLGYDYRGFGVAASSFIDSVRFRNTNSLDEYINGKGIVLFEERLDREDRAKEAFILLLRRKKGVDMESFENRFGIDINKVYTDKLERFKKLGFMKEKNGRIYLTSAESMLVSNSIFSELI